jgi:chorismate mutase / prephenate dehydratase
MAKKPVATKRVPKPALAKKGPSRPVSRLPKPPQAKALVKKPSPQRNGQAQPATEKEKPAGEPRRATGGLEASLRSLDRQILQLINKRAEGTIRLLESAPDRSAAVFDLHGDDLLWQELTAANPGPLPIMAVRGVFRQILSASRQKVKTHRVAYLGPQFSFTHLAAIERFGESADLIPVSTIASVFEEVNRGHADFGLVPIENSTDGRIVDTLDMFTRLPLRICGEVQIAVHHNLCSKSPRSEITEIYSKPQALSQCREWLSRNMPQARLIEVTSTSTAAQLARDKPGVGAVASRQAAVEYDLQVVAEKIEDNANNVTRFAVIGDQQTRPSGHDRTAVLLQIPHEPGSLSDSLQSFKKNKLNLSWIESFPLRGPETGYLFFIDFEGHLNEARTKKTLEELARRAIRMEVLGSYPRSEPLE